MKTLQQYKAEQLLNEEFRREYEEIRREHARDDENAAEPIVVRICNDLQAASAAIG